MNRIDRRIIMCMLLIAALAIVWNLLGGPLIHRSSAVSIRFRSRQVFGRRRMRSHPLQQRVLATWIAPPRSTVAILQTDPAPRSDTKMTKRSQFVARRSDELVPANRG